MTNELAEWLSARRVLVDRALERWLPAPPAAPPIVAESMRYSVFAGGKRFRPMLTLAAAEAVAGEDEATRLALPAACALELIHTYSLVHDDLPAMDDDALRRGRPTAHIVYGEGQAILVGDGLLTEAFHLLAREPDDPSPAIADRKLRTLALVARAAGAEGMVGGQAIDLQSADRVRGDLAGASGDEPARDAAIAALRDLHARKTGALIRAATVAGALMAGAGDGTLAAIDRYATELGLAFQIVDDVLDVEGNAEDLGKTAGKDAASGKLTYPALFGIEGSRRLAEECRARAVEALRTVGIAGHLPAIADWVVDRRN